MRINNSLVLFSSLLFVLFSCKDFPTEGEFKYPPDNEPRVTISQGVWGNVWFWEGDFMPSIDPNYGTITPIVRDIYIYDATNDSMVVCSNEGAFFTEINSTLVTIIRSNRNGFFQISLAPGKYSFFVKEGSLFYANEWDEEGYILSATVTQNNVTKRQIDITYKATF